MDLPAELSNDDINRFSRQIILPHVGVNGQLNLNNAAVLIVGAGGLGCPCAIYLAGAGIGHIGVVDHDQVELNNLHRQILHRETSVGEKKVESVKSALSTFNSKIKVSTYSTELNSNNAIEIIKGFDIIVDCTDNVATRYLLNDACFFESKPLVSGSALQMEGQLTVYSGGEGPCYRCLFPIPPHPSTVTSCGEGGVLGVIPGTIGVLQAHQVLNIILGKPSLCGLLLLFDGNDCSFRRVKLRQKLPTCSLCGPNPTITHLIDYEQFCQAKATDKNPNLNLLSDDQRLTPAQYAQLRGEKHMLIDVRTVQEFAICRLQGSVNIPIRSLSPEKVKEELLKNSLSEGNSSIPVYVVCRRGNDSQKAVLSLQKDMGLNAKDIIGGLHAWAADVDPTFPVY